MSVRHKMDKNQILDGEWRHENTGRLLVRAARQFEERILQLVNDAGFAELRLAHLAVPRNMDIQGNRITEIARRAGITKQSMSQLVGAFELFGLVELIPDTDDRRAKIVMFTRRGLRLMNSIRKAIALAEDDMRRRIGDAAWLHLKSCLKAYVDPPARRPLKRRRTVKP